MAKTSKATAEKAKEGAREADLQNQTPQDSPAQGGQATQPDSKKQVQSVEFPEATPDQVGGTEASGPSGKLDIILDMNVPVMAAVGQTQIPVRRLLQLGPGSVLKLDKPIDAPADLFLKDAKFASGDVVVVDGQFAVRIKQIIGVPSLTAENTESAEKN